MEQETRTERSKGMVPEKARHARMPTPWDDMDRMMEALFSRFRTNPLHRGWPTWDEFALSMEDRAPNVDVVDRDTEIVVRAELPGVDKKDVEVTMSDNSVTIKATTRSEEKEEKGDYYRCEIHRGSYARTVALPGEVDREAAKAVFKDGVLELTMPKREKARKRSVKVE